jgi:hypothetical protein
MSTQQHWQYISDDLYAAIVMLSEYMDDMPTAPEDLVGREHWYELVRAMRRYEDASQETD